MNRHKVVGKVGKFNLCFRSERLTSHAGVVLLQDFAQRLGVARQPTRVSSATIPCSRFGPRKERCSFVICGGAVPMPLVGSSGFCARPASASPLGGP